MTTEFNPYLFLFKDSFITSILLVPRSEYAIDVMLLTKNYDKLLLFFTAILAATAGSIVNFLIGRFIYYLNHKGYFAERSQALNYAAKWFNKWGYPTLLFSFIPLWGGMFTTAAGILRIRFITFLILILISHSAFYFYKIWLSIF